LSCFGSPGGEGGGIKGTVEFRQHEGTLDGERAVGWIRTVAGIVDWVEDQDALSLVDFLMHAAAHVDSEMAGSRPYDVIRLFEDMGLKELAECWRCRRGRGGRLGFRGFMRR
jgi:hypothetical protein